jgi:hypothetical protein
MICNQISSSRVYRQSDIIRTNIHLEYALQQWKDIPARLLHHFPGRSKQLMAFVWRESVLHGNFPPVAVCCPPCITEFFHRR